MINQSEINESMRSELIDWIIEVGSKLNLRDETIFMSVNIIDRYLNLEKIKKTRLQIVGVTALVLAAKYEEIYPPETKQFISSAKRIMMKEEIYRLESQIIKALKFELSGPSPLPFLKRFLKLTNASERINSLATYFVMLQMLNYEMIKYNPSLIGAACVYLAFVTMNGRGPIWNEYIISQSGCKEDEVRACGTEMLKGFKEIGNNGLSATKKMFSQKQYMEVGKTDLTTIVL